MTHRVDVLIKLRRVVERKSDLDADKLLMQEAIHEIECLRRENKALSTEQLDKLQFGGELHTRPR